MGGRLLGARLVGEQVLEVALVGALLLEARLLGEQVLEQVLEHPLLEQLLAGLLLLALGRMQAQLLGERVSSPAGRY